MGCVGPARGVRTDGGVSPRGGAVGEAEPSPKKIFGGFVHSVSIKKAFVGPRHETPAVTKTPDISKNAIEPSRAIVLMAAWRTRRLPCIQSGLVQRLNSPCDCSIVSERLTSSSPRRLSVRLRALEGSIRDASLTWKSG